MTRQQARALQKELADAGFYKGEIDGLWGNQSMTAADAYTKASSKKFDLGDFVITDSIRGTDLVKYGHFLFTRTGATIDIDGGPHAYNPQNTGLDRLADAGGPGNWYGVLVDTHGKFILQGTNDPAPGYCISTTSLKVKNAASITYHQVNAEEVPFMVLPGRAPFARLGDYGTLWYPKNNKIIHVLFADVGPRTHYGEISYNAAKQLGIPPSPISGGIESGLFYFIYPNTSKAEKNQITDEIEIDQNLLTVESINSFAQPNWQQIDPKVVLAYYNIQS